MSYRALVGFAGAVAFLALGAPARAQSVSDHFGGNEGTTTIPASAFVGLPPVDANGFSNFDYFFPGGARSGQIALQLPNGAEITQLCLIGNDMTWNGYVSLDLLGMEYPRVGTTTTTPVRTMATATSGLGPTPGLGTWCAPLAAPIVVKSFGDIDGNGVSGWTGYALRASLVYFPGGGVQPLLSGEAFGSAVVVWRRTVSPAPAVASFIDVPATNPQFRYVQAFVASGLATGCAADRFCPDTPVTRGQLAVFLSVALGLHFPN